VVWSRFRMVGFRLVGLVGLVIVVYLSFILHGSVVTSVIRGVRHDLHPAVGQGHAVLPFCCVTGFCLLVAVVVPVVRSLHTVHELVVCRFIVVIGIDIERRWLGRWLRLVWRRREVGGGRGREEWR